MQSTIFKQKSNYWRVFALCFFTAVLLFAPHCIVDAVAGGGYFHYAGDFNDQQINFYQYANAFVKNGGSFSWATDLGSGFSIPTRSTCWAVRSSGCPWSCPRGSCRGPWCRCSA